MYVLFIFSCIYECAYIVYVFCAYMHMCAYIVTLFHAVPTIAHSSWYA